MSLAFLGAPPKLLCTRARHEYEGSDTSGLKSLPEKATSMNTWPQPTLKPSLMKKSFCFLFLLLFLLLLLLLLSACPDTCNDDGGTSGLESMLGRIADALEKRRGRSISAAFSLQGAHAESADEFEAFLDDVQSAGLSGVDTLNGPSLIHQNQGMSAGCGVVKSLSSCDATAEGTAWGKPGFFQKFQDVATHAGSSGWDSGRASGWECRKSDGDDESLVSRFGAAVDPQHNLEWAWPLLGVLDPEGRHNMQRSPLKQSGLISFHTETVVNEEAKRRLTSAASSTMPQTDFSQLQGVRNELKKQRSSGEERQACQASTAEARKRTMEGARCSSSGFSRNWEREVLLPVVPCVQRAQRSTLTQGANMPCGAPRVPEQGSIELVSAEPWRRYQRR